MRLLNEYNAKLVAFLRRLRRAGYDVKAGEELASEGVHDNSTVVVSWGCGAERGVSSHPGTNLRLGIVCQSINAPSVCAWLLQHIRRTIL